MPLVTYVLESEAIAVIREDVPRRLKVFGDRRVVGRGEGIEGDGRRSGGKKSR